MAAAAPESYSESQDRRVIGLLDLDQFHVQVIDKYYPENIGEPRVVANSKGRITAVSYEAKKLGINRNSTPTVGQALAVYSGLCINEIPERYDGRSDSTIAQQATFEIVDAIRERLEEFFEEFSVIPIFEYSSGDEFYIDFTELVDEVEDNQWLPGVMWENTFNYSSSAKLAKNRLRELTSHVPNLCLHVEQERRLLIGSILAAEVMRAVLDKTTYESSVGIASNKLMAKIGCGIHKPGSVTIIVPSGFIKASYAIKLENVPGFGGKKGALVKEYYLDPDATMGDAQELTLSHILNIEYLNGMKISVNDAWKLLNAVQGICNDPVKPRAHQDSCGVTRQIYDLSDFAEVKSTISLLCQEEIDKLQIEIQRHGRFPRKLKLAVKFMDDQPNQSSTLEFQYYDQIPTNGNQLMKKFLYIPGHGRICFQTFCDFTKICEIAISAKF